MNDLLDIVNALQHLAEGAATQPALSIPLGAALLAALLAGRRRRRKARPIQTAVPAKIGSPAEIIDVVARLTHTHGRNRARHLLCTAIAEKGTPQEQLAALTELSRTSPMDATGASLLQDHALRAGADDLPTPPRETTIVIPPAQQPLLAMENLATVDGGTDATEPGHTRQHGL